VTLYFDDAFGHGKRVAVSAHYAKASYGSGMTDTFVALGAGDEVGPDIAHRVFTFTIGDKPARLEANDGKLVFGGKTLRTRCTELDAPYTLD